MATRPVSWDSIAHGLASDEPDYERLAGLAKPAFLEQLTELAGTADPLLASKATWLASLLVSPLAVAVIVIAASRPEPEVRVAAAASLARFGGSSEAMEILEKLRGDADPGVRKFAERSAQSIRQG